MACGPSPRKVHYADTYFERCAAADAAGLASPSARRDCWRGWLDHHTIGQPQDKVRYAEGRVAFLGSARGAPAATAETAADGGAGDAAQDAAGARDQPGDAPVAPAAAPPNDPGEARLRHHLALDDPKTVTPGDPARVPQLDRRWRPPPASRPAAAAADADPPTPRDARAGICRPICTPGWNDCAGRCDPSGDPACFEACDETFLVCLRACP